jgi:predicted O-methyltransferase YrrM
MIAAVLERIAQATTRTRQKAHRLRFQRKYGFPPAPPHTYLSGYDVVLDVITKPEQLAVPGDWLEIGVLLGGNTYHLCRALERSAPGRRVIAVDIFARGTDDTRAVDGRSMDEIYEAHLAFVAGQLGTTADQEAIFRRVTAGCRNLDVVIGDSKTVELPTERLSFAYIDGNHAADYVASDFERAWDLLSPGGIVALDDYAHSIPDVTRTVHELVGAHAAEIERFWVDGGNTAFVRKAP